jgi:hypothetical protein
MNRLAELVTSVAIVLLAAATAAAQTAGEVSGRVTDGTGAPVAGAAVTLTSRASGTELRTVTATDGRFHFSSVPGGPYGLAASALNFASTRRADLLVEPGRPLTVDLTLVLSLSADVVVTAKTTFRNLADLARPEENLVGIAAAASEGAVTARQLDARPVQRAGEVLETVPGLIISQHSGEGKANQYYLRGFNLDHGTDFRTTVAGLPVNMPTHAHGHGYSDVNFLIPELVSGVQYRKGPYYAEQGDFSAAGAADINYVNRLEVPIALASLGRDGWQRLLAAASPRVGPGHLMVGLELNHADGPWERPDDYRKANGIVRYSVARGAREVALTALVYRATWDSTDQTPRRAVASGLIGRFGNLDPTSGGDTARTSVVAEFQQAAGRGLTRATAYVSRYRLNLFSNFTFFLDDPERGDQFEQADRRWTSGGRLSHRRLGFLGRRAVESVVGGEVRHDDIPTIGLYHTGARERLEAVREDGVGETAAGVFAESTVNWTPWLRTTGGLRADGYRFAVTSNVAANSGTARAGLVSPKGTVVLGPWQRTEFYLNGGYGFHSNDARGVTIAIDPASGEPADRVTPLVRAKGAEIGLRTVAIPRVQTTLAVWRLDLASELLFVGDAGTTEGSRPSHRDGVEAATYMRLSSRMSADVDVAWSRARFTDADPAGDRVPGAAELVAALGVTVEPWRRVFGSVRWRYFGPRPLIEDNSVRSDATSLVNAQFGVVLTPRLRLVVDAFNLFNTTASDIDYFYTSRLPGEPDGGLDDLHTHPALPRTARFALRWQF